VANDTGSIVVMGSTPIVSTINYGCFNRGIEMEYYVIGLYILVGVVALLGLYNKIRSVKEARKKDDELRKQLKYHKRPAAASFHTDKKIK